jgi:hypothetical protein
VLNGLRLDLILSLTIFIFSVFTIFLFYFQIEGFDDGGGRVIVKLAIGGLKMTMNEFMVQPVGKAEYAKYAKILSKIEIDFNKIDL